ncbi:IS200/IS605 family accessory protein TnpB-related protein [Streptacidiphilus sp. N1-10]|uniref:IS200/IS605 family accessory protein TnpB-related protein n=1 Tax=Streptacidiphilus jeojiensis TaxID=3229225 RepID=A0ABV6XI26_9ACTN
MNHSTDSDSTDWWGWVPVAVVRSVSGLRMLAPPRLADSSGALTVRTRLHLSPRDAEVLLELGGFLTHLAARDLAERVRLGEEHTREDFARRKRALTAVTSSRWAGTITRGNNEQWALARRTQAAHLAQLHAAIATLRSRLAVPIAACEVISRTLGYPSAGVRASKQRRLAKLEAVAASVGADALAGRVHVVRGGRALLHTRLHLEQAGMVVQEWERRWFEARCRIEADGESGKRHGNETISITPGGTVTVKLPPAVASRFAAHCDRRGRYTLEASCSFSFRSIEWRGQVEANRAVSYTIRFKEGRCYLSAAFTSPRPVLPEGMDDEQLMGAARAGGILGVDHNADHLAAWRLDAHGNPVGRPERIEVDYRGSSARRDAQVRLACSELIRCAKAAGATALVIEDLGFDTSREACGWAGASGRAFRKMVAGMPTAKFAVRLVAMAHRANLAVIVVDPAYSSRWGAAYWQRATSTAAHKTSRHDAAAIVIGRRGQGLGARRRAEKTVPRKTTEATATRKGGPRATTRGRVVTEDHRPTAAQTPTRPGRAPRTRACPEDRAHDARHRRPQATVQPAEDRSRQATEVQSWTQDALQLSE